MDNSLLAVLLFVVAVVALTTLATTRQKEARRLQARLAVLGRRLDAVSAHLGVPEPEPHLRQVEDLVLRGRTIEAIAVYRDATGAELREARNAVYRMSGRT